MKHADEYTPAGLVAASLWGATKGIVGGLLVMGPIAYYLTVMRPDILHWIFSPFR